LNGTTHTNAGSYASDGWSFHDASGNYQDASGTVSDCIGKATPTVHAFTINPINTTISAQLTSLTNTGGSTVGSISSGLLTGTTQFSGTFTDLQGDYVGTLLITTATGTLTLADIGNLNPSTGAFTDQLTVTSGTGQFAGAS